MIKRRIVLALSLFMLAAVVLGCGNSQPAAPVSTAEESPSAATSEVQATQAGGSGFSRTIQTISELQPNAEVVSDGLSISRGSVAGAESEVVDWVRGLGYTAEP